MVPNRPSVFKRSNIPLPDHPLWPNHNCHAGTNTFHSFQWVAGGKNGSVRATVEQFGGLDILFANAGEEGKINATERIERADFERVLTTNVIGPWLALKAATPAMRARGGGAVATSSVLGAAGAAELR
jgi:hypothetical protein